MGFLNAFAVVGRLLVAVALILVAAVILFGSDARMAFFVIALSIGLTGLVFVGLGTRLGRISGLDKSLRTAGVPGIATITSVTETGIIVNGERVIEFRLDVDSTAHSPLSVTIRQRAPRLLIGAFSSGAIVAVLVDPTDREHVTIDWEATADVVSPPTVSPPTPPTAKSVRDADDLLRYGRRATALITSMEDSGDTSELGLVEVGRTGDDDRLFIVGLEIRQAGLTPYEIRIAHRVPERLLGRVGPRTRVDVAVDRDNDRAVAIDWSSVGR